MHLHPSRLPAARYPAAQVSVFDDAPGAFWDDVSGTANTDRHTTGDVHRRDGGVTEQQAAYGVWEPPVIREGGGAVGVQVQVDAVPVAPRPVGDSVQGAVADLDQRLRPINIGLPPWNRASLASRIAVSNTL